MVERRFLKTIVDVPKFRFKEAFCVKCGCSIDPEEGDKCESCEEEENNETLG